MFNNNEIIKCHDQKNLLKTFFLWKLSHSIGQTEDSNSYFQGIIARDLDHTEAIATVTAGGVGFSYANIRLKSERGSGLNYQIEVYV